MVRTDGNPTVANGAGDRVQAHDFSVVSHGSIYALKALTAEAAAWIEEHVGDQDTQTWGGAVVVEHRYIRAIVEALEAEGFSGAWQ